MVPVEGSTGMCVPCYCRMTEGFRRERRELRKIEMQVAARAKVNFCLLILFGGGFVLWLTKEFWWAR
jgi:hypothetical protein